jgi:hypothetical protein
MLNMRLTGGNSVNMTTNSFTFNLLHAGLLIVLLFKPEQEDRGIESRCGGLFQFGRLLGLENWSKAVS